MSTHINLNSDIEMVNVSDKTITHRTATAQCTMTLPHIVADYLTDNEIYSPKGPVFQTARIAGISAAKQTGTLIPLCHPLPITHCHISFQLDSHTHIMIQCRVETDYKTGVEMEALTGVSVAALTVYDMCKSLSHDIRINEIQLIEKTGGKNDFKIKT